MTEGAQKRYSAQRLKSFIHRIERVSEEIKALQADVREIYNEAKSTGFDPKIMRKVIALRKLDAAERQEMEALIDVYEDAIEGTPLGQSALATAKEVAADKVRAKRTDHAIKALKADPEMQKLGKQIRDGGVTLEVRTGDGKRTLVDKDGVHEFDAETGEVTDDNDDHTKSTRPSKPGALPVAEASTSGNAGKAQTDSGAESERTDQESSPAAEGHYSTAQTGAAEQSGSAATALAAASNDDGMDIPDFLWRGQPRDRSTEPHEQSLEC